MERKTKKENKSIIAQDTDPFPNASYKMKFDKDGHSVGFTEWEEKMLNLMMEECKDEHDRK